MTVAATTRRAGPFAGNGVTTVFPFAFKVFSRSDVAVILTDSLGVATTLTLDSNYSVLLNPDQDAAPGGSITYPILVGPSPLPAGSTLTMLGALPYDQGTDITNAGRFLPQVIENALDKLTILAQQLKEISGRTLQAAVGTTVSLIFPAPSSGKFLRWRTDLTGLENAEGGTDSLVLQGLLADSTNAARGGGMVGFGSGVAYPAGSVGGALNASIGQCRLVKSGTNLVLLPFQGNRIMIGGKVYTIPAGGASLAPAGTTAGTLYYIYAYAVGTVVTLEFSTTAHVTDGTTGGEIKVGDPTRQLVGLARPIASPGIAWQDADAQRFVLSWFNRRPINCGPTVLSTDAGNVGLTASEISASLRLEFLSWGSESSRHVFEGGVANNVTNAVTYTSMALDGTLGESLQAGAHYTANALVPFAASLTIRSNILEGYHFVSPWSRQNVVSTSTYRGGSTAGDRCVIHGLIQG